MLISPEYAELNRKMFEAKPGYGTSGARWVAFANDLAISTKAKTLLDYGCGRGTLRYALMKLEPSYTVLEYDPAVPGKTDKPLRADVTICGDVMEHVEPDCVYSVLDDIYSISRLGVLFIIATRPAAKHLPDGRNAHLIIEPAEWWVPKLMQRWRMLVFRDFNGHFLFTGVSR